MHTTQPIGHDLSIATMRELAMRYNAISFDEQLPVDTTDYGYMVNPQDAAAQFGVATYKSSFEGFAVTHSIVSFFPHELSALRDNSPNSVAQSQGVPYYNDVIDITLPYVLPHVIITPKLITPLAAFFGSFIPVSQKNLQHVRLEGDFSDYVDAVTVRGQDIIPFIYLAPDVMERILPIAKTIIVEWIGNHIYIYYHQPEAKVIDGAYTTHLTGSLHEKFLKAGLEITDKLGKNARPARVLTMPVPRVTRPNILSVIIFPFVGLFSLLSISILIMINIPATALFILGIYAILIGRGVIRAIRANLRIRRYEAKYGVYQENIE